MKNHILIFFLLISSTVFSQQLNYKTCGRTYNAETKKLRPSQVREIMASNTQALNLYNSGRRKKTWGNVLFYTGVGLVAADLVNAYSNEKYTFDNQGRATKQSASHVMGIVGGTIALISVPIKVGYPGKIKKAINQYNDGITYREVSDPKISLIASNDQFGVKITF